MIPLRHLFVPLAIALAATAVAQEAAKPAAKSAPKAAGTPAGTGSAAARYGLKFKPVEFSPPHTDHAELANGMPLDFYADPALPLVSVMVRIGAGSVTDAIGKTGAAELTGTVMRNGGTAAHPGDTLDRELENRGADISVETTREETWFKLSLLREDAEWGMQLLADILANPAFPQEKLDEARGPKIVALQQRLDEALETARALYPLVLFGRTSPWGATATPRSLQGLTLADLREVFAARYVTGNMRMGISGGIDFATAQALAAATLGKLPRKDFTPAPPAPVEAVTKSAVYTQPREATQNVIFIGHEGIQRHDERKFVVRVFNNVLSGGFTSRLFNEVRSQRGLAYYVGGRIGEGTVKGPFYDMALTKVPSTAEALKLMTEITTGMATAPPRVDEMDLAIQSDVNAFVFFFDSGEKIVQQKIALDAQGYAPDYLQTYVEKLSAVKAADVQRVAGELIHMDKVTVLVLGDITPDLKAALEKIGPITEISDAELRKEWL